MRGLLSMRLIRSIARAFCFLLAANCLSFPAASAAEEESAPGDKSGEVQVAEVEKFTPEAVEFFQQKVLPLLEARCFECHAGKSKRIEGGLRLDARPLVLKGGDSGTAAIVGKPDESLLIESVNYESFEMPPRGRMPAGEIAILRRWIEMGLPWSEDGLVAEVTDEEFPLESRKQSHWAWEPIQNPAIPELSDADWPLSDFDRFIMAKLDEHDMKPSADADRRTLIRRASFDLIGLPPTIDEIQAFVADPAPTTEAFARVVDRLLDSPHFGERWGRHWLDLVRYAETLGHEFDYPLHHAWKYRDYVIRALNDDVPYDLFVKEQLAGDLLPNPRLNSNDGTNESIIGTGFWLLGELKHAPVDVKGEEAGVIDNQIDVFSKTLLGLTLSCCRCHDHKFDAMTMRDYYAMSGFLQSSRRQHAFQDPHGRIESSVTKLRDVHARADEVLHDALEGDREAQAEQLAGLLLAAREVLFGEPKPVDEEVRRENERLDVVIADFEGDSFGDWDAEGDAFAAGPVAGKFANQQPVSGFMGQQLVNSFAGNDNLTGTLTSPEFTISHRRVRFLIGGGHFKGKTCVNLVVDGKVVRTAVGRNREKLDVHEWDVSDLLDERAVLQIVDHQKGGWGHVNVDHFVLTNEGPLLQVQRPVKAVAQETGLDAVLLTRCVQALLAEETSATSHPAWGWKKLAAAGSMAPRDGLSAKLEADAAAWQEFLSKADVPVAVTAEGAGDTARHLEGWSETGWAFDTHDDSVPSAVSSVSPSTAAKFSSVRLAKKLRGVLRSPTFTLTKPNLVYRIAGEGITVRLIIDGYVMDEFNGLLFRGCKLGINNPRMHWARQGGDVANFVGHRAHIEIIDNGDGWAAFDDVRLIDSRQPTAEPVSEANSRLLSALKDESFEEVCRTFAGQIIDAVIDTTLPVSKRTEPDRPLEFDSDLAAWAIGHRLAGEESAGRKLDTLRAEAAELDQHLAAPEYVLALTEGTSENEHVFIRGSHANPGDISPRRMLEAIAGADQEELHEGSGRLELAERLLQSTNPFPARVQVNRVWSHLFGRGIVASVDNFGVLGQAPTHRELLDHLAIQFVEGGWSVKRLIRSLMLTRTYQMDSRVKPEYADLDPQNDWWHRMPVRRLEGEAIRDAILSVSGRLDRRLAGPPIPVYVTSFMQGRGRPRGGPLDGNGRRSIYTSVNRNFLSPMMLAFDTPIPFTTIGRRTRSNVPAQALILMNDPFVSQQAETWAKRELAEPAASVEERIDRLYQRALGRFATEQERNDGVGFLQGQASTYGTGVDWQSDVRVWKDFCHVLFNVKEFIFLR